MHQLTVGQFKSKFSQVLEKVQKGESIGITYGKNKKRRQPWFHIKTTSNKQNLN